VTPDPAAAVERALALLDLQRPQAALEHLQAAAAADPESTPVHCLIALAKLRLAHSGFRCVATTTCSLESIGDSQSGG